jgi:hypothetical protein
MSRVNVARVLATGCRGGTFLDMEKYYEGRCDDYGDECERDHDNHGGHGHGHGLATTDMTTVMTSGSS